MTYVPIECVFQQFAFLLVPYLGILFLLRRHNIFFAVHAGSPLPPGAVALASRCADCGHAITSLESCDDTLPPKRSNPKGLNLF